MSNFYRWHVSIFITILNALFDKVQWRLRNVAFLKDWRILFSILPTPPWVLHNTVALVLWQPYDFEALLELCV